MLFVTSVFYLGGLTLLLANCLAIAHRHLFVPEDPRIDILESMLPRTNCGGCGYPGCRAFSEALLTAETSPSGCSVSSIEQREKIARYLGVDVGTAQKKVARLACAGGNNVANHRAHYIGKSTCAAATLVAGGGKACFWGCLGLGDCQVACTFDAITIDVNELPVVNEDKCTACGDCVAACPKDLFSIQPATQRLWVACSAATEGDEVLEACEVGCTACGRCAMDAPDKIEMRNGLPIIDYSSGPLSAEPTQRCPTGAIVWFDKKGNAQKGAAAKEVIRKSPRRDVAT